MDTETRVCPVCGTTYGRKPYLDDRGRVKSYGRLSDTCSRKCAGVVTRSQSAERFWAKVDKRGPNECWPFTGARMDQGYGMYGVEGKIKKAHRVAYVLTHGAEPTGDVRHSCDNPPCCNPAHLFDGTTLDNVLDMESKGRSRHPRGSENGRAKLSDEQVRAIRSDSRTQMQIAADYDVSQVLISQIKRRVRWGHIPD